ncbi:AAA family ATPase [Pseudoteredinibacter isoporae]|uniref:Energy-coupling factor transporter ATP-binding protein EcfA2 n=1 Tax=Pseudoteredinibacter isoporae TaxID=570281 RepID=A0A7X0MW08_9GAMM|nr:AAA family ATPase [Pseudoteredinibacter isoporae]MBB6522286.1 energy-coupling factor transporter ATP-binding protein EcfA2 [Pseudoteredinibacter isoporae]NHO87819.1 AAA family ATPase [Pseudoteredinibacter isoporae]NIB23850.1 AAA family ATPase [Pseudoteredinibacter isoporae]
MNIYYSETEKIQQFPGLHLFTDNFHSGHQFPWDDFGYTVLFDVRFVKEDGNVDRIINEVCEDPPSLGHIRFLIKGVEESAEYLKRKSTKVSEDIFQINDVLNITTVVSLPREIDTYSKINKLLGDGQADTALRDLCDASYYYARRSTYEKWPGFEKAILRKGSSAEAMIKKGRSIANGTYRRDKSFRIELEQLPEFMERVSIQFGELEGFREDNVNILIGKNGAGKSRILQELADVVLGINEQKQPWHFFHKLIVVSFSPFDDFRTELEVARELYKHLDVENVTSSNHGIWRERVMKVNEYAYIGFKNEEGVFDLDWPKTLSAKSAERMSIYDKQNHWWRDRYRLDLMLDTLSNCIDFDEVVMVSQDGGYMDINADVISNFSDNTGTVDHSKGLVFLKDGDPISLSSGQRMYSYMIPAIVAELDDESLVLIDEPELYLHPELEVGLINMLKSLLKKTSSYAVIATHSAILTREVARSEVHVLRRETHRTTFSNPTIETYGASTEAIIREVFDDFQVEKQYEDALNAIINVKNLDSEMLVEVKRNIGDSALAHLLSKMYPAEGFEVEDE